MAVDRTPGDFGGKLRDARERRGISLRQIANATKISVAALEALERNDISKLPGGIFSRAFVRSYALEAGLDPDQTIQEFIAQFPHDTVTAGHPKAEQVEENETIDSDRRMATTFLRLAALSVPIAAVVLYFGTVGRPVSSAPIESTPPAAAAPASAPAVERGAAAVAGATPLAEPTKATERAAAPAPPLPAPAAGVAPAVSAANAASPDVLTVTIVAKRPCWVWATADGQKSIDRLLQAGERHTIEVRRELRITAGDGSAIALTLNGADARPLGKSGQVAKATLNLNNYKDYLVSR